jgi:hypothetical protein
LPPWKFAKPQVYAHQDERPNVVERSDNTFATRRLGVQFDRFKIFVGHNATPASLFCPLAIRMPTGQNSAV